MHRQVLGACPPPLAINLLGLVKVVEVRVVMGVVREKVGVEERVVVVRVAVVEVGWEVEREVGWVGG